MSIEKELTLINILVSLIKENKDIYSHDDSFELYLKLDTLADTVKHLNLSNQYKNSVDVILENFKYFSTPSGREVPWSKIEALSGQSRKENEEKKNENSD